MGCSGGSDRGSGGGAPGKRFQREYVRGDFGGLPVGFRDFVQSVPYVGENGDAVRRRLGGHRVRTQHAWSDGAAFCESHFALINSGAYGDVSGRDMFPQGFREFQSLGSGVEYCKAAVARGAIVGARGAE